MGYVLRELICIPVVEGENVFTVFTIFHMAPGNRPNQTEYRLILTSEHNLCGRNTSFVTISNTIFTSYVLNLQ